jgi:AraC-like DNA-binding protein
MRLPHQHSDIEINYVLQGEATYIHRDSIVRLAAGAFAILWGAVPHQLIDRTPDCDFCALTIPLDQFLCWKLPRPFTQALLLGELLVDPDPTNCRLDCYLLPRWHEDLALGRSHVALKEIEARLWRVAGTAQPHKCMDNAIGASAKASQMARFIVEHYAMALSVTTVAEAVGLHPGYAMTCFKKTYHMTMLEYILQYRVTQAERLLVTTDLSVLTIAMQTGFGSASSFYTAFKRFTGREPRSYRSMSDR